ncbi:hypothetical protein [Flagellimonas pacifica]|uniref:hypothetical protein n=1 Tax=Flagellimonas pacifica TaxID=1247520 RepID=UPI001A9C35A3|nr:hypothetical protein [Allomuricauda parva]
MIKILESFDEALKSTTFEPHYLMMQFKQTDIKPLLMETISSTITVITITPLG